MFSLLFVALLGVAAALSAPDYEPIIPVSRRLAAPCSERCEPAFVSMYSCLQGLYDNRCIIKSCGSPSDHPWTKCTSNPDAPPPSPTPSSCSVKALGDEHDLERFEVQCDCPNSGLRSVFRSSPLDVHYCMRACFMMSEEYRQACDVYDRSGTSSTTQISQVFATVGRGCCENKCEGVFRGRTCTAA
eukprot:TRINITY_DN11673_c0_g2_i1.p1 TRINITY_DN11673_c0_g2~~TRINITY_DN11673_c0_g2_i1.p1  ORF type:complete len:187 (-),score=13.31 TRINITY_DN11673_c0_g2_i1:118-678(-)